MSVFNRRNAASFPTFRPGENPRRLTHDTGAAVPTAPAVYAASGGHVFFGGTLTGSAGVGTVWKYDAVTNRVVQGEQVSTVARFQAGGCFAYDCFWLIGGKTGSTALTTVTGFNTIAEGLLAAPDSYMVTGVALPNARAQCGVAVTSDDRILVIGGINASAANVSTVWRATSLITSGNGTWEAMATPPFAGPCAAMASADRTTVLVVWATGTAIYDVEANTWTTKAAHSTAFGPINLLNRGDPNKYLLVSSNQFFEYDVAADTWTTLSIPVTGGVCDVVVIQPDGRLYSPQWDCWVNPDNSILERIPPKQW